MSFLHQEEAEDGFGEGLGPARGEAYAIAASCDEEPACRDQLPRRSSWQVFFGTLTDNDHLSSFESRSAGVPGREH